MATTTTTNFTVLIAELAEVRAHKAELAKRESAIRAEVLEATGKVATPIADPATGAIIAEVVASVRRSVSDWESFEVTYPEAYEALVRFTDVLTLNITN